MCAARTSNGCTVVAELCVCYAQLRRHVAEVRVHAAAALCGLWAKPVGDELGVGDVAMEVAQQRQPGLAIAPEERAVLDGCSHRRAQVALAADECAAQPVARKLARHAADRHRAGLDEGAQIHEPVMLAVVDAHVVGVQDAAAHNAHAIQEALDRHAVQAHVGRLAAGN